MDVNYLGMSFVILKIVIIARNELGSISAVLSVPRAAGNPA